MDKTESKAARHLFGSATFKYMRTERGCDHLSPLSPAATAKSSGSMTLDSKPAADFFGVKQK
jgi:hypothetical protein